MLSEIVSALAAAGYEELAQHIATSNYHKLVGKDIWGKEGKAHYYADVVRIEQFPPGGKTRGKKTGVISVSHDRDPSREGSTVMGFLHDIAKYIHKKSWADLVKWIKFEVTERRKAGEYISIDESQQKAVDAPNPVVELNSPKDFTNIKKVKVKFDTQGREITLGDLNDKINEPRAVTMGPRAYDKALQTLGDWQGLAYRDILVFWGKNKIKYHDWLAMD
jgi:hypothetical protein